MSVEDIQATRDDEVEQAIVDSVIAHLGPNAQQHYEIATRMPVGFQVVFSTWVLEAEVGNGGFLQYFYNTRGDFAEQGLEALRRLGAGEHATVLEAAMSRVLEEGQALEPFWRQGTLGAFFGSYEVSRLGELDHRWYALGRLSEKRLAYIRRHTGDFE